MIYTYSNNRTLKYSTPLIDYIKNNNLYSNENLMYTRKYTDGTFSITNPTSNYKNSELVNGYPHFHIPLEIIMNEIEFFINECTMYDNNILIRYGDTHPHKPVPKLGQIRNLVINNSLSSMIGSNATSYFVIGDISIKSLNYFKEKYDLDIEGEKLFIDIVNNNLDQAVKELLDTFNKDALIQIQEFLKKANLDASRFYIESDLYNNQELYKEFKNDPKYKTELKKNGELKYTLQEMMFICSHLKNQRDCLINIIGSNQSEHIKKVNNILLQSNKGLDVRFLSYGMCNNAESNNYEQWSLKIQEYIYHRQIKQLSSYMNHNDFLKALMIINKNDMALDFDDLDKHINDINRFNGFIDSISLADKSAKNVHDTNDLLCKMALVCYNLNRAIEMGNPNMFYRYLLSVANEYESHKDQYKDLSGLYYDFICSGMKRLGYPIFEHKEGKRMVLK